jgi:hypothetical protein
MIGDRVYLAFASGAIGFDCQPCGRCCRSLGVVDTPEHFAASPALRRLSAFAAEPTADQSLIRLCNYADGCRMLTADNRCELHLRDGLGAKPAICRLFPFSRMLDVAGLWVLLPHPLCPWQAPGSPPALESEHAAIRAALEPILSAGVIPDLVVPVTVLEPQARRALEERLRDALPPDAQNLEAVLADQVALQERLAGPVTKSPERDLWLDLLRSAGEPPPLTPATVRVVLAGLPALRILLAQMLPLAAVPLALDALVLWLRTLSELGRRDLTGEDLLHLFATSRPLLRVLVDAGSPVPWGEAALPPVLAQIRRAASADEKTPLGEMLLRFLRADRQGAICLLMRIGAELPPYPDWQ